MAKNNSYSGLPTNLSEAVDRIKELEKQLLTADVKVEVAYEIAKKLEQQNKQLQARIHELEDPRSRHGNGLGWVGKIVQVITRSGRPLRSREIMHELSAMDNEGMLSGLANPNSYLSVVLAKGVKAGRLKIFKMPGTRGGYYALAEWLDKKGELPENMRSELF